MSTTKAIKDWREVAVNAQKHRDETIAQVDPTLLTRQDDQLPLDVTGLPKQRLSTEELEITTLLPEELVKRLTEGSLTCVEVTEAYLRRAALAQSLTNCITELLPERALERARYLDGYLAQNGKPIGPMHGLPISVKEHINFQGLNINGAYCAGWGITADDDVHMIKILRDAGCVFFARTNQPQLTMHLETANNLYGTTVNPFNRNLTAGGSSGGEGALIGLRGTCLGIGSDIGGSIRVPAANNGVFGLRPTAHRVPVKDMVFSCEGEEQILVSYGPLSTSLEGIDLFMSAVLARSAWLTEPSLIAIPWRMHENQLPPKLKVAVMWDDGVVNPHPPIIRALRETVDKLKDVPDIEIVDWKPYKHDYAWQLIASLYFPDGGENEKQEMAKSGEPWLPLSRWILTENPFVRHLDVTDLWALTVEREHYRKEYAALWNETATDVDEQGVPVGMVDVILCPVGPGAASPLECTKYWSYTSQWNLLDYPALTVPTGMRVDLNQDLKTDEYTPRNEDDKFNYELYSPERYANAPLSLQIVGRRFEDEKVIQAARRMSKYCDFRVA